MDKAAVMKIPHIFSLLPQKLSTDNKIATEIHRNQEKYCGTNPIKQPMKMSNNGK